ncbi:MAG: hypothetical protein CXR30_01925 [Geobacter sp.]|nr:MAG: hypothetical protein CXR30_01925 [Geobacter sp.]
MKKLLAIVAGLSAVASNAMAADITVDYSTIATGLMSQASTAITAALPVLGAILGIVLGVKLFKKFSK